MFDQFLFLIMYTYYVCLCVNARMWTYALI